MSRRIPSCTLPLDRHHWMMALAVLLLPTFGLAPFSASLAPLRPPLLSHRVPCPRMDDLDVPSAALRARLLEKQAEAQRNGARVLGIVLLVTIWFFSVPPDIRRTKICGLGRPELRASPCVEARQLGDRVLEHYSECSAGKSACVQWDFSVDPESKTVFEATLARLRS